MAILTKNEFSGSHWYTRDGHAAHRTMKKNGDGDRATTVRDARQKDLIPSVTNILNAIAKPQLENWKISQAVKAALRSPMGDESEEYYIKRIIEASKNEVNSAAELGSAIHDALEHASNGDPYPDQYMEYVDPALQWVNDQGWTILGREKLLVNASDGYAGTADLLFQWGDENYGVLDYKTRKTIPGKKVTPYDGQGEQLAAYCVAAFGPLALEKAFLVNLYISTTEPGRVEYYHHENGQELYECFTAAATIWRKQKKYDPRVDAE